MKLFKFIFSFNRALLNALLNARTILLMMQWRTCILTFIIIIQMRILILVNINFFIDWLTYFMNFICFSFIWFTSWICSFNERFILICPFLRPFVFSTLPFLSLNQEEMSIIIRSMSFLRRAINSLFNLRLLMILINLKGLYIQI